jgi:spermidine synthase
LLVIAFIKANSLTSLAEDALFTDDIIYAKSSKLPAHYRHERQNRYALFLNGNLQFNSFDEYRYHEALVHPAFAAYGENPKRVLVLGGRRRLGDARDFKISISRKRNFS